MPKIAIIAVYIFAYIFICGFSLLSGFANRATAEEASQTFVSLKANKVHMRVGPGKRYPIVWVYKRRGLPLEVLEKYDNWRKVRDPQGEEGWIHHSLLSTQQTVYTTATAGIFRSANNLKSEPLAIVQQGVIAKLEGCEGEFCKLKFTQITGWSKRKLLWPIRK